MHSGSEPPVEDCITYSKNLEEIELHASNLLKIEYRDHKMVNLVLHHVPKLEIMFMSFSLFFGGINMMTYIFGEFAKYVPNLRFLTFATKPDFNQGMLIGRSRFRELRVLHMTLNWIPTPVNLLELIPYLESFPVLEELQLNLTRLVREEVGAVNGSNEVIELRRLKKVEINGFQGSSNEMEFVVYILKNAPFLLQMCIIIKYWKEYFGAEQWRERTWCAGTCENNIKQNLQGQALSPTAELIIQRQLL